MPVRTSSGTYRNPTRTGGGEVRGRGDVTEGHQTHSLSIGKSRINNPGTEYTEGLQELNRISKGAVTQPMRISKPVLEASKAFAEKHTSETKNTKEFYEKAKGISKECADINGYFVDFATAARDNGFKQFEANSSLARKQFEILGKREAQLWETKEAEKGYQAARQEFRMPSNMRSFA